MIEWVLFGLIVVCIMLIGFTFCIFKIVTDSHETLLFHLRDELNELKDKVNEK